MFLDSAQLTPEFTQRLNNKIRELLQQMERGLKCADPQDCTAYTGWTGRVAPLGTNISHLVRRELDPSGTVLKVRLSQPLFLCSLTTVGLYREWHFSRMMV